MSLRRLALRLRMSFGYVPNMEWLRARLSRAVALDRARALGAISELERCLVLQGRGGVCLRLRPPGA